MKIGKLIIEKAVDELLTDPIIEQFAHDNNLTKDRFIHYLSYSPDSNSARKRELTTSDYLDIISGKYDSGWNNNGSHCIVYISRGSRAHTHCGNIITSSISFSNLICDKCSMSNEGKKIIESIENLSFDPVAYRNKKTKLRVIAAKIALKKQNLEYTNIDGMIAIVYKYNKNYLYIRDLGLVIKTETILYEDKHVAVGFDRNYNGTLIKLSIQDLKFLKNTSIIIDVDILDKSAFEYIEQKIKGCC